jgi:arginyl-tRNA synthetase
MQTTSFTQQLSTLIQQAVKTVTDLSDVRTELEHPADSHHGDLSCNVAMVLFKQLSPEQREQFRSPKQFAEELVTELNNVVPLELVKEISVAGPGFINFRLSEDLLFSYLKQVLESNWNGLLNADSEKTTAIVEYSSPNIAKPFTIGHLRSTIIGDAVANILEAVGVKVFRDNHLGDWGTQFGKQIYAILNIPLDPAGKQSNEEILDASVEPVKDLVNLYVEFHKQAEEHPELEEKAREWFKKLEDGDKEARRLWQKCVDWSWKEFQIIYERLGVSFTENNGRGYGESFFEDKMGPVIQELEEHNLLKESEGAKLVFLEEEHLPPLMILKKDGATLYATRDLATDKFRKENIERYGTHPVVINEVGAEQAEYFQQLYAVEYRLGWYKPGQRVHVKHGHYRFEDKKMSTRKGNVIWLTDVLDEAVKRAEGSEEIGLGALKWNDLKRSAHLDVVFNWDEVLSMDGNSGPYLQYAYARSLSVLNKAGEKVATEVAKDGYTPESEAEQQLLRILTRYPGVVQRSAAEYAPHHICTYLFELAQHFNSFYQKVPILRAEEAQKQLRLQIAQAVANTIQHGLTVLGIKVVEKM